MSVQIEKLEHNMAKLTVTVPAADFTEAVEQIFRRERGRIQVPGFRKGKAPLRMIEKLYGAGVFFEEAANSLIPKAYEEALKEVEETVVSRPDIQVEQIGKGQEFIFSAQVALKPEVVLGEYKGLSVPAADRSVSDEEVQAQIDRERDNNARMIDVDDRPVEEGDIIRLDYNGTVDGVPFEGGQAADYPLTIGSGSFIPGFEEQLIGKSIGEETDVKVTFPEEYHAQELRGKEAVFACRINSIQKKELPELDDEFAQDVSEFDTLEEYRADVRAKLQEQKDKAARIAIENAAVDKAVEQAQMDIPEAMIQEQIARITDDFMSRIRAQGMDPEQYLKYTGMNMQQFGAQMRPEAEKRIRSSLVLEAVAKAEGIEIPEEQVDEEIEKMAGQYNMDPAQMKEMMSEAETDQIRTDLAVQKALQLLADSAVETEEEKETV